MNEMTRVVADAEPPIAPATPVGRFDARFTSAEFLRMIDRGAFEDWKIELVSGELQRMPPPGNDHSRLQVDVITGLASVCSKARVRGETGVDLGDDTVLGCDAALLKQPQTGNQMVRPDQLLVVVEVAETSRFRELDLKRTLYATAGVETYWVIDGKARTVYVHAEPTDGDYINVRTVRFGEPLAVPGTDATITLS